MKIFGFILLLCLVIHMEPIVVGMLGNETDRLALVAFKDQITGDPLGVMSSWNNSFHFCKWQGVTCSHRRQRVTVLYLNSLGLEGSISPHIGNLTFLRRINLENNRFHGQIPEEVGRLSRLQDFSMSNNSLGGEIPVNLSRCSNLVSLILYQNKLVGNLPIELGSLSKLVLMYFFNNNLTGEIPPSFGNLSYLNTLSLRYNGLQGSIPESLGQLKSLNFFGVGSNMLSGRFPIFFKNLSSLEILSVANNQLNGSLPHDIGLHLPNLRYFFVGLNQFSGTLPISLFNASRLEKLCISANNFTGTVPNSVANLKSLQGLVLSGNNLGCGTGKATDLEFLTALTNCSNLQILDISINCFLGMIPSSISNLSSQLNSLYLGRNYIYGSIPTGIGNLVNLIILSVQTNLLGGIIPMEIGNLQKLQQLSLANNRLSGQIPSSLGNISQLYLLTLSSNFLEGNIISNQYLQVLDLFNNSLSGIIPKEMIRVSLRLTYLSLAHNSFTSALPLEIGSLKNLEQLDVSNNKLSGEIPSALGNCLSLEYLYLKNNFFEGPIPLSFGSLKGIQELDLSHNNLSGQISKDLQDLNSLQFLNLSFNNLEGELPIKGVFQNASAFSIVGNENVCGGIPELGLSACDILESKKRGMALTLKVAIGVILFSSLVSSFLVIYWKRRPKKKSSTESFLRDQYTRVSYNELHKATDGFASYNLIGIGSFGSVYKGILRQHEEIVAVKVLNLTERGASKSFMIECEALRKVRHRNLLKIFTACSSIDLKGNDFKALVFNFMPNGSLDKWLHSSSDGQNLLNHLNLAQRLNIAIDVASALDYLHNHCETPIVHCDLKPSNVLLDEDMTAHVGDFGLAKFLFESSVNLGKSEISSIAAKGTIGYIPPEYGMGAEVSIQGDVYSYGILLLEMLTGRRPTDDMFKDVLSLHQFSKMALTERVMMIVDPRLLLDEFGIKHINNFENNHCVRDLVQECLTSILRIGVACSTDLVGERMDMKDVLAELCVIKEELFEVGIPQQRGNAAH